MSNQVLRSGTAVGALVREAEHAESKADFIHKMGVALKEANETSCRLDYCAKASTLTKKASSRFALDNDEVIRLLVAIVKTSKVLKRSG